MNLHQLVELASNKENFTQVNHYIDFALKFLEFAHDGLQAVIVCQNETQYRFWQYSDDGHFNITRPLNSNLMYTADSSDVISRSFLETLANARELEVGQEDERSLLRSSIYTVQQSIGATLDALPAGMSNKARKINGDLFERLIQLLIRHLGVECSSGFVKVPVRVDGHAQFNMSYQHDLILKSDDLVKAIGSVKTSSKDRIDKIFIDKFLFNQLTESYTPHLTIFLNDVQRGRKTRRQSGAETYKVSSTFLPGHFKGYTIKLNPLDGVYYCDIRPNMEVDTILKEHIQTIDHFFSTGLWLLLEETHGIEAKVEED